MLSIKQREEREALVAKREGLREELAFAVEHKKPWQWGSWESGRSTLPPVKNMVIISVFPSLEKPIVALKMLSTPNARSV
jgi:hypothetical protein